MPEALTMTPAQAEELKQSVLSLEKVIDSEVIPALARRGALWKTLKETTAGLITPEALIGPDLVKRNESADLMLEVMAEVYVGLRKGEIVLVNWQVVTEKGIEQAGVGMMKRSDVPQPSGMLGNPWLQYIPVVLVFASVAALGTPVWLLLNAGLDIWKNKVEAEKLREETAAKAANTIAKVATTNPDAAAALAGAMVKAGRASIDAGADPGEWFSKYVKPGLMTAGGLMALMLAWIVFRGLFDVGRDVTRYLAPTRSAPRKSKKEK